MMNVTVIGDAFMDIIVPVKDVKPGLAYYKQIGLHCGGTANVNTQIAKLGVKSKFVGSIGNDPFGEYFKQNLRANGIKDLIFVDKKNPTGLCISMVYENGEKAMVANRGANDYLKKENIDTNINEIINSKIIYFSGYSLLSKQNTESILHIIRESRKNREICEIYFNPGAPNVIQEDFKDIIKMYVDVIIMNIDETKILTGKNKMNEILSSLENFSNLAVITLGENGCVVLNGKNYTKVPTEKLVVSDTTGAGDAFSAGFIVGRLKKLNEVDCAKLGNESALMFLREKNR